MGVKKVTINPSQRQGLIGTSVVLALFLVLAIVQALLAKNQEVLPPDLSSSTKAVNKAEATAGTTLNYEIRVKNTGNEFAIATLTDTLSADLTYVPGSLSVQNGGTNWGESGGVISWNGAVNAGNDVVLTFKATLADDLQVGTLVVNSAEIVLQGETQPAATPSVSTLVIDRVAPNRLKAFLPIIFKGIPQVTVNPISRPNADNKWTVTWNTIGTSVTSYELQEAQDASFSGAGIVNVGLTSSRSFTHERSFNNVYYYRVRALVGAQTGPWSNVELIAGNYRDDFSDANSGWRLRRTNSETGDWEVLYRSDSILQLLMLDNDEYFVASPLRRAPGLPYNIETQALFEKFNDQQIQDQHTFAIIFGGDWNGDTCPNANSTSCFNTYYRLRFRFRRAIGNFWEYRLDWVTGHDSSNDQLQETLIDWNQIKNVSTLDPSGWNEVDVFIQQDGTIQIAVRDVKIGTVRHPRIETEGLAPYFGLEVSTKAKPNARIKFDYLEIEKR